MYINSIMTDFFINILATFTARWHLESWHFQGSWHSMTQTNKWSQKWRIHKFIQFGLPREHAIFGISLGLLWEPFFSLGIVRLPTSTFVMILGRNHTYTKFGTFSCPKERTSHEQQNTFDSMFPKHGKYCAKIH